MISVGDVNRFCLECVISSAEIDEGEIFVVVNNERFGSKGGSFCLSSFFNNLKTPLLVFNPMFPELYEYSASEIFRSLDAVWEDTCVEDCPIEKSVKGFFDDPTDVTNRIIFYGGDYAFDGVSVVMISNGESTHLMIRDEEDMRMSDVTLADGEYMGKFYELGELYRNIKG